MSETADEQAVAAHNTRDILTDITIRIEAARHEIELALGLFDDLIVYEHQARNTSRLQQIEGELEGLRDAIKAQK